MVRAVLLFERRAGRRRDARVLQELQAVQGVRRQPALARLVDGPRRQRDTRESVHRPVDQLARHARKRIERVAHQTRAPLHGADDGRPLFLVRLVRRIPRPRRVDVAPQGHHARHARAQVDAHDFVQVRSDACVHVAQVEIPASEPALASGAFRNAVEAHQLLVVSVRGAHAAHGLVTRDEGHAPVNVLLVHFVGHEHEAVLVCEADQGLQLLEAQALARRVARVYADDRPHADALRARAVQRGLQAIHGQGPTRLLVQVIADQCAAVQRDRRGVQRVLRDRHQHAVVPVADHGL
mmetsp:Transcript_20657/g.61827  ORF Transcript_20657/g.61827 Transcript_20657/m.61827 type:complete len:295 (-) Transcript_20657:138-1022(-)